MKITCDSVTAIGEELRTNFPAHKSFKVRIPLECKDEILSSGVWPKELLASKFIFPRSKQTEKQLASGEEHFVGQTFMLGALS